MDTIEGQLTTALAGIAAKEVEVTEARAVAEKAVAEKIELDGKVAELSASVATLSAEKADLLAKNAALESASVTASEEAAKIAASVGVAPVESAPSAPVAKTDEDIRAEFLAMPYGVARTAFFNKNRKAILGLR